MEKHITTLSAVAFVILASLCLVWPDRAKTPLIGLSEANAKSGIAEKIIGTWKLISIDDRRAIRPENEFNPNGYIMYDSTNHMAVQITRRNDRARFLSDDTVKATNDEKAAAFSSYAAYYGTYKVNEAAGTITHHVEGSLTPNDVGKDFVRYFKLSGNHITLTPVDTKGQPGTTTPMHRSLTWERVK